jgi:hypothetical protein
LAAISQKSCAGGEAVIVEPNEIDSLPDVSVIVIGVTSFQVCTLVIKSDPRESQQNSGWCF